MRFLMRFFQIASAFLMCKVVPEHQINGDFSYHFLFPRNESVINTAFSMGEFAKVGFILILSRRRQLEASRRHGPTPLFDANALSFASQSSKFSMRIASDSPAADVILMRIRRRCETGKPTASVPGPVAPSSFNLSFKFKLT